MRPLTDEDQQFVRQNMLCPDCRTGAFLAGPRGGGSQNVKCNNHSCGHYFNLIDIGASIFVHRIRENEAEVDQEISALHPEESVPLEQIDMWAGKSTRDEQWIILQLLISLMEYQEAVETQSYPGGLFMTMRQTKDHVEKMAVELAIRLTNDNVRLTNEHLVDVGDDEIADGRNRLRVKPIYFAVNMHAPGERYEMVCLLMVCFTLVSMQQKEWGEDRQNILRRNVAELILRITRKGVVFATDEEAAAEAKNEEV